MVIELSAFCNGEETDIWI